MIEPPDAALGVLEHRAIAMPRAREREREQRERDDQEHDHARHRPVRDLRGRSDVADQEHDREEVEHPVREHRAEEHRPCVGAPLLLDPPAQNRDPRELADAAGQNGVREQADPERGKDERGTAACGRDRLLDHLVPGGRPRDHREEVERDRGDDPLPGDEPERVEDETPVRTVPDEERDHAREREEHERGPDPRRLQQLRHPYAANAFGDSTIPS